ncbi:MAG: D-tyrosyl-tRNA(Tyr) deacylase [Lachnospiraceae bacterium]|nr:D-tyrosyl-tRNA(Tyr) deacylase [Lachnospiraceae bacterium]
MRFLIQRVNSASVLVDGEATGSIEKGLLVFIGICESDDEAIADKLLDKLLKLRIFDDADGKTNLSVFDVSGELLLVSQFTLYANCKKGNRPSFTDAAGPEKANGLYEYIIKEAEKKIRVGTGIFGADMKVTLENDGPFTVMLDSDEICPAK